MLVLLISMSVLFVAACLAVVITRSQAPVWRNASREGLPWATAASTTVLAWVSVELHRALGAIRSNRFSGCLSRLHRATLGASAFLVLQAWNARLLFQAEGLHATRGLFYFSYGLLVGLHALHVLGGFVPLAIVHGKVLRRDYSSSRHAGFTFCVQYWHYLGVVWLLLLVTLLGVS